MTTRDPKKLDDFLQDLMVRQDDEPRRTYLMSDGSGCYWTRFCKYSELSDDERRCVVYP